MNGMEGIFGIIGIGAGLYSLYAWFQLKFKGIINTSILVPKDTNIKKCKDKEAYRAAAGPKLLVLAVVLILYGAEDLYNTYVQSTGKLFWVILVLVLAVLVWFAWTVKKIFRVKPIPTAVNTMWEAIHELEVARNHFDHCDPEFVDAAIFELNAAECRLIAMRRCMI